MACPRAAGRLGASSWARSLRDTGGWRIDGQTLELLDGEGNPLALLQAVYLY